MRVFMKVLKIVQQILWQIQELKLGNFKNYSKLVKILYDHHQRIYLIKVQQSPQENKKVKDQILSDFIFVYAC